ncbi:DNA methyltransferase [Pasteurella multocida]|uniref:DNA methyltransferase n=1 Tax=Pasteurellaceae TaxID=712 RepID=UPI00201FC336|nr:MULTISPECIES: DNA methyltransferase [Pasteurellaceae]MCL7726168.1 DNA methyltransferase [Actinobacillus pleuropneumoniae]MCL7737326.1 DNA methyltransferase [Actinobacillus pleuropneumoniae]MDX3962139.1 DNA methyltransferase [Pasteurella multocida]
MVKKIIIWALFDSGNGCYTKAAQAFPNIEIYPIGIDIEKKNNHFISLNLADYCRIFGDKKLFNVLDNMPKPDVILASPPCESFSVASAMWGGNACWKQEHPKGSRFVIRNYKDYEVPQVPRKHYKYEHSFFNRINGELCIYNTIDIIKRYQPKVFVIENPLASRMWDYINDVIGFHIPFDNPTYYGNYNYPVKKPTKFKSNIPLSLIESIYNKVVSYLEANNA